MVCAGTTREAQRVELPKSVVVAPTRVANISKKAQVGFTNHEYCDTEIVEKIDHSRTLCDRSPVQRLS